ncbi:MAG: glycosyltransferase family 4 protein [Rhodothermia bacterium]|nr:MAG: glycosyltransferase family 4 protein [Rhodothermia bacterium]
MARILMILDHSFPPDLRVENEIETLVEAGFEVCLLAIGPDQRPETEDVGGVRIVRDRISASRRNRMRGLAGLVPVLDRYIARRMLSIYASWPFQAVHAHDLYLVGGALRGGRQLGVKVVADLHENWVAALKHYAWSNRFPAKLIINLKRWDRLETDWLTSADGVIVVIEEMAERLSAKGISEQNMIVLPNTIHRAHFDAYGIDKSVSDSIKSDLTILYTGGMDVHRGIAEAIRAMPTVRESIPSARLILVGDGAVRGELENLCSRLNLQDSVQFLGWQRQEKIPSYIAGADIGLIPHLKTEHTDHTIPHKLFHYMHLGLPVVASNCRPIERIVTGLHAGLIYSSGEPEDLALAILTLAENPVLRAETGEHGRRGVATQYNWETTASGLKDFYRKLLV